jgi:hypothetical protein
MGQLGIGNLPSEKWPAQDLQNTRRKIFSDERIRFFGSAFGRGDTALAERRRDVDRPCTPHLASRHGCTG